MVQKYCSNKPTLETNDVENNRVSAEAVKDGFRANLGPLNEQIRKILS